MDTTSLYTDGNLPLPAPSADNFEESAYPGAPGEIRTWLREQRGLVRAFLASDFGRTGPVAQKKAARTRASTPPMTH